jgi:hypothetical protein
MPTSPTETRLMRPSYYKIGLQSCVRDALMPCMFLVALTKMSTILLASLFSTTPVAVVPIVTMLIGFWIWV